MELTFAFYRKSDGGSGLHFAEFGRPEVEGGDEDAVDAGHAEAGGGFVNGDEVARFEAGGDAIAEGLVGVVAAGGGGAEVVDEDGDGEADVSRTLAIFWRLPFRKTSKSAAVRTGRWRPFLPVTVTRMEGGPRASPDFSQTSR